MWRRIGQLFDLIQADRQVSPSDPVGRVQRSDQYRSDLTICFDACFFDNRVWHVKDEQSPAISFHRYPICPLESGVPVID